MSYPFLSTVFNHVSDDIWGMLELKDILKLSTCCKFSGNLGIDAASIHTLLERAQRNTKLGNFFIRFPDELTTGLLRRILYRLNAGGVASVNIDIKSGRILLSIGSAFSHKTQEPPTPDLQNNTDNESDVDNQEIFRHLEHCSMDEYDDFNPRHPKPRDKAHRRGDSYFNSDIDMVVNELYSGTGSAPFDLKNIAASAANDDLPLPPKAGGGLPTGGGDLKSRLLAKKKAAEGSGPLTAPPLAAPPRPSSPGCVTRLPYQLRASAELNVDSDEDK